MVNFVQFMDGPYQWIRIHLACNLSLDVLLTSKIQIYVLERLFFEDLNLELGMFTDCNYGGLRLICILTYVLD